MYTKKGSRSYQLKFFLVNSKVYIGSHPCEKNYNIKSNFKGNFFSFGIKRRQKKKKKISGSSLQK